MRIWLLLMVLFSVLAYANDGPIGAKATVSARNVELGNLVVLKIRARGSSAIFPTIKTIDGVKVLRQHERVTNIHTYNHGKLERERTTLVLTFAPQKDMTIPSYAVEIDGKTYSTKPIKIKVKDPVNSIFSLKLRSNKSSVMVGESFLVTVSFYLRHGAVVSHQPEYSKPEFEGFFVETVDEGKSYDAGEQQVTEIKYILTPHTEGDFTIGPAHAKIGLQDRNKRNMLNMGLGTKWLEKASNTVDIEVLPQIVESDLVGTFSLSAKVDRKKIKANQPVNLTVNIEGEGNLFNFDLLDYDLDGVTIYSDDAKVNLKVLDDGRIYSSYSKKFVFISDKSFQIPERIFSVYDLHKEKVKTLKIEAFTIEVEGSPAVIMPEKNIKPETNREVTFEAQARHFYEKWQMVLLSFILGALIFYLLRYLPERKRRADKESEALTVLYGHTGKDPEVEEMVRKLYARKNGDTSVEIDKRKLKELTERFK